MIILTNPVLINSVLGGTDMVGYDKFVLYSITFDANNNSVRASIQITSTVQPEMQTITGQLIILTASNSLAIEVPQFDFYRKIALTAGQKNTLIAQVTAAQDDLESGLLTLNLLDGVQTSGV